MEKSIPAHTMANFSTTLPSLTNSSRLCFDEVLKDVSDLVSRLFGRVDDRVAVLGMTAPPLTNSSRLCLFSASTRCSKMQATL